MKRISYLVLITISIITIFFGSKITKLSFDYQFENLFPLEDPDLTYYFKFRSQFGSDSDFFLIGLKNEEGIFQQEFLNEVEKITTELENTENVFNVLSPTRLSNPVITPFGLKKNKLLHHTTPSSYKSDSVNIYSRDDLVNSFFSSDGKSVTIFFENDTAMGKEESDKLLSDIDRIVKSSNISEKHVAGKLFGQDYYLKYMTKEFVIFLITSIILLIIFVSIAFRSIWAIILSICIVLFTIIWLLGIMSIAGRSINLFTVVLPTIIFVVGISDVVHILEKYIEEIRKGVPKQNALRITLKEIGRATLMTSITTSVGFATLMTAGIQPVRELGMYAAMGVFIAFVLTMSILPPSLYLLKIPSISTKADSPAFWEKILRRLFVFILGNQKAILAGWLILIMASLFAISKIKVDNQLLEDFRADNPIKQSYTFFEDNFSGFRSMELAVTLREKEDSIFTMKNLIELQQVEEFLKEEFETEFVASPVSIIKSMRMASKGGLVKHYKLPESQKEVDALVKKMKLIDKSTIRKIVSSDGRSIRVSSKIKDFGGYIINNKNEKFDRFVHEELTSSAFNYRFTGFASLIDKNNEYLAKNMLTGLLIAFGAVAILMALLYRSFIMLIIAIIPNIVPLIMIGGLMGTLSIDLKVATSIIFTIAFGIAVDDSIHFLSRYKLELEKGKSYLYALKRTYLSTGKAIIVTSLILSTGFLSLVAAEMNSTYYIGLLISICLMFAVLSDLLLLPIVILLFKKKKE